MSRESSSIPAAERHVGLVRGTRDWSPPEHEHLAAIESKLLDRFAASGYLPIRTPVLERTDLHERKSGAGIVSRLYQLSDGGEPGVCLRPELTAGVVRAYAEQASTPPLPWRVSVSGPVFRHELMRPGFDREFHQVGVEMLGAGGPDADAEVIALAWNALRDLGVADSRLRIGHVGLLLEVMADAGLPEPARAALVERLSDAASEGGGVATLDSAIEQFEASLSVGAEGPPPESAGGSGGFDRLFRTLVPSVVGRRTSADVLGRLRRKWELAHAVGGALGRLRARVHELAALRGPVAVVLDRMGSGDAAIGPESVASLRGLVAALARRGADLDRVELDLGFGRGIGFYSQMVFEIRAETPSGPVEVCGGGRYDGLARVLGSDRDDRGAGFAFGLERLAAVVPANGSETPR